MIDLKKIEDKLNELTPLDKGSDKRQRITYAMSYPDRVVLRDGKILIYYVYECNDETELPRDIEDKIADSISELLNCKPSLNDSICLMGRPDADFRFKRVGITVKLEFNVELSLRVTRHSMRTLLGLE